MKRLRKLQESLPTEDFTPRDYQLDLLENALHENTVAALGSDGGKSFLALSLLRELAQDMRRHARTSGGKPKTAIITVETDAAADDYVRAVEDHTDFTAGSLKNSNAEDVIGVFEVVISSHENFFAAMTNGKINADDISVIVIDECTSAVARHPYQKLFDETFSGFRNGGEETKSKPRVLALTSALLTKDVVEDPVVLENVIGGLERAFRSNLRTSVSLVSVDRFGYTKDVRLVPYSLNVPERLQAGTNYVRTKLKNLLDFIEICEQAGSLPDLQTAECLKKSSAFGIFKVAINESLESLRVLGLWPTYRLINIICRDFRQTHLKNLMEQRLSRLLLAVLCGFQEAGIALEKMYGFASMEKGDERILHYISPRLKIIVDLMDPYNPHNPEEGKPYIPVQYLSMIVNVGRPYLAWTINRFIRDLKAPDRKCRYNYVTSSYCLGSFNSSSTNPADACYFGMPFKVQEEILRRFRNRDFNILISTCTNDVSLDVPQCTFAIQFDPVNDYLTYIHAKHRTKSKYGTLCVLIPEENTAEYIADFFKKFQRIDSTVLSRCPDYITRGPISADLPEVSVTPLKTATTGVQITMAQAIGVINRYCSNLPSDAFANLTPLAEIVGNSLDPPAFVCTLTLPINAPLKKAVEGLPMPTKRLAKQSAALEMCRKLYDLGELDESLAPVSKDTWKAEIARYVSLEPVEAVPEGGPKPGTTKRRQYYGKKIPKVLSDALPVAGSKCYFYAIELKLTCPVPQEQNVKGRKIHRPEESSRMLGILSGHKIPCVPDFNIYDRSGEVRVSIKLVSADVLIGVKELEMAQYFHYVMFSNVLALERFSLRYNPQEAPSKFLVIPVLRDTTGYIVDWSYMESVFAVKPFYLGPVPDEKRETFSVDRFGDAVIMPWYRSIDQPQSFYVEQICPWLTVESEFPDDGFKTFYDYYLAKYKIAVQYKEQPLLDVDHTSTRLNLLLPRFLSRKGSSLSQTEKREILKENKEPRHRQILIPELCQVNPVPASLWRQGICLPTILHRMECLLVMEELMSTIKISTGIGGCCPEKTGVSWPMLDYGWSFEEKIKNLEGSHLERDAIDIKNATLIEKARLRHEEDRRRSAVPSIGMWNPADADALSECGSMTSGFEIGTWSMEPLSKEKMNMFIDDWRPDEHLEQEPAVPFFEHIQNTYGMQKDPGSGKAGNARRAIQAVAEEDDGFRPELEWGYNMESEGPGINLVSGFSDTVMQAIEKDLTNLNLDDSGMLRAASEIGDNETIADSTVSTLPVYNIEALDPLKDREEEDIGPVISSILHLRFSESAPDELRGRLSSTQMPLSDVFEEMSEFSLESPSDGHRKKEEKKKDLRTEFGEVVRSSSVEKEKTPSFSRPLVLVEPTVKFDDDRDPTTVPGPDPGIILQAFTSSNANDGINLERLETVGDSFLKFSMTTYLYFRYNGYHEGKLSFMRSLQVSNYNLYRLGFKKQFGEVLLSSKFEPTENWLPPCYVLDEKEDTAAAADGAVPIPNLRTQHCISDKTLADCAESLIGAYLISSGIKAAQLLMSWLGLNVLPERIGADNAACMVDRFTWFPKPGTVLLDTGPAAVKELDRLLDGYSKFEDRIGYKFNDRAYLLQAFTHASYTYNRITDCYQRLEFLGDAVLDYLITRHLFEDLSGHTPGALTDLRSALVNNAIFASLSVRYEYHKYVKLMSPAIFHLVEKYVKEQRERDQNLTLFTEDIFFYDPAVDEDLLEDEGGAEETECPKVLGDVFESVAGAIYLDSGMSLDAVWKVYYSMMKSEIEQCSINIPKSPVRELLELEPENVKFSVPERTASGKIRVVVEIFDKGKFVGLGRNYRTAKCTAAKQALKYLRSLEDNNWK